MNLKSEKICMLSNIVLYRWDLVVIGKRWFLIKANSKNTSKEIYRIISSPIKYKWRYINTALRFLVTI